VEHRHHAEHHLARALLRLHGVRDGRAVLRAVGARHALGPPGRAGGVEHHADVGLGGMRAEGVVGLALGARVDLRDRPEGHLARRRRGASGIGLVGDDQRGGGVGDAVAQLVG
jgi:hypothetical protein